LKKVFETILIESNRSKNIFKKCSIMKSGKWLVLLFVPFVFARDEMTCKSSKDCHRKHEECLNGICHCEAGALSWDGGDCLKKRNFGETCTDQNECLMAGDPHMDCVEVN
jgi:hypothetical protein